MLYFSSVLCSFWSYCLLGLRLIRQSSAPPLPTPCFQLMTPSLLKAIKVSADATLIYIKLRNYIRLFQTLLYAPYGSFQAYFLLFSISVTLCICEAYIFHRYSLFLYGNRLTHSVIKQTVVSDKFNPFYILENTNEMSCLIRALMKNLQKREVCNNESNPIK